MKKLNFGCGEDILEGYDNIDIEKNNKIFKSFDFNKFPYPIKDNTYEYVLMKQVLEHVNKPDKVLHQLARICKNNAIIRIEVPYYNNKGAFGSLEHMHYFSDETFRDFCEERAILGKQMKFIIVKLNLTPTNIGSVFPAKIREKLSLFLGGLISQVHVELKINKN